MEQKRWSVGAVVVAILVLTAACSSANDATSSPEATGPTEQAVRFTPDADAVDGVPAAPACSGGDGESSSRGVTDTAVNVAVVHVDTDTLVNIGFAFDPGPVDDIYRGLFDAQNAAGGVCGRQLKPTVESYDILKPGNEQEVCTRVTQDTQNFAVIGGDSVAGIQCLAGAGKTLTLSTFPQDQSLADEVGGRLFSTAYEVDSYNAAAPGVFDEEGLLEGDLGLVYVDSAGQEAQAAAIKDSVIPGLANRGHAPVVCTLPGPGSTPEGSAALPLCVEQLASAGVTTLVAGLDQYTGSLFMNEAAKQGFAPQVLSIGAMCCGLAAELFYNQVSTPDLFDGIVGQVARATNLPDSDYVTSCFKRVDSLGLDLRTSDMTPNQQQVAVDACTQVDLVIYGIQGSGAALTDEGFIGAMQSMPTFVDGYGFQTTFADGKHFGPDEVRLETFHAADESFGPYSDARYALG